MIKDLKMGIKMMRYCYNIKINIVMGIIVAMMGIAFLILELEVFPDSVSVVGGYFFVLASMLPLNALYSMNVSHMVLASPARKKMQIAIPVVMGGLGMFVTYLVMVIIYGIMALVNAEKIYLICNSLIITSILMLIMMLYMAVSYKYFVVSVIAFAVVYSCFLNYNSVFGIVLSHNIFRNNIGSFVLAAVIGLAVLVIAGFLMYLLSLLIYRMPMSKNAMASALRKEM